MIWRMVDLQARPLVILSDIDKGRFVIQRFAMEEYVKIDALQQSIEYYDSMGTYNWWSKHVSPEFWDWLPD